MFIVLLIIGVARIFQRGGHNVSKWGHLHAVILIKKKVLKKGL